MNNTTLQLTPKTVLDIYANCRSYPESFVSEVGDPNRFEVVGARKSYAVDLTLVEPERDNIINLLKQLPDSLNNGASLADMHRTRNGNLWTEGDPNAPDILMALGVASGLLVHTVNCGRPLLRFA